MKFDILNLDGISVDEIEVNEEIFALSPRADLLHSYVKWQQAKKQGSHKTLTRAEISRTGKKLYKQKGTGGARHGSSRAPQFRGGGKALGPVIHDHGFSLPKKVKKLAIKHALASKVFLKNLLVLQDLKYDNLKTKFTKDKLVKLGVNNCLFIESNDVSLNFRRSIKNIPNVDIISVRGINVYDIINREKVILTFESLKFLEEKLNDS